MSQISIPSPVFRPATGSSRLLRAVARGVGVAAVLITAWQLVITLFDVPPYMLPAPGRVLDTLWAQRALLARHGAITLLEMLLGLALGTALGVAAATAMAFLAPVRRVLMPALVIAQALPVFAVAPMLVLWLGFGLESKLAMTVLIVVFPVTSSFLDGLRRADPAFLDLAALCRASRLQTLFLVRVPAALPSLGSGLRIAAAVAPIGAVVGEWVGAAGGLGFLMLQANARMQTDLMFAALALLALAALALRFTVEALTRRLTPWSLESSEQERSTP